MFEFEGLVQVSDRLVVVALLAVSIPPIVVSLGIVGLELDCLVEVYDRLGVIALIGVGNPPIIISLD